MMNLYTCLYKTVYLSLSLFCLAAGLTGIGLLYAYYAACPVSQFWISVTLIVSLICLISSLLEKVSMGLLTPAFLFLYFDYQCWSAILSNPNTECNKAGKSFFLVFLSNVDYVLSCLTSAYVVFSLVNPSCSAS